MQMKETRKQTDSQHNDRSLTLEACISILRSISQYIRV